MTESAIHDLVIAYRAATYAIRLPGGRRALLRVGAFTPHDVDPLLDAVVTDAAGRGAYAGIITAWNPFSEPALPAENRDSQRVLLARLRGCTRSVLPASGFGVGWREPGFAALGIESDSLDGLAREFRQNAIVTFGARDRVRLRLFRDDWRDALAHSDVDFAPHALV